MQLPPQARKTDEMAWGAAQSFREDLNLPTHKSKPTAFRMLQRANSKDH